MSETYTGYYIPGPNDHGDTDGLVAFLTADEVADLLQTTVPNLAWIDHGAGRMVLRQDMQLDDAAPLNPAAVTVLQHATSLGAHDALPAIRGPVICFPTTQIMEFRPSQSGSLTQENE